MAAALPSVLAHLHLPPTPVPPITELLSSLCDLIGSCPDSSLQSVVSKLEHLFNTADPDWLLLGEGPEGVYLSVSRALIGRCALPVLKDDVSVGDELQYEGVGPKAEAVSRVLVALLRLLAQTQRSGSGPGQVSQRILVLVAPDVCVFSITHLQVAPWSSASSRSAAQEVMQALLEAGPWTDSAHLLMGEGVGPKGILGGVLDLLQPQLNKDSMFSCEAVKLVFSWTLLQVSRESVSLNLARLLPPTLLLTDHYRPETCVLGVSCVHHIVLNTSGADLMQLNRAEVLYQALFRLLYNNNPHIIQTVLSCLMDLLLVLEKPPSLCEATPVNHHDAVLRLVLTQMEAEHKVRLRRVYAGALPPLVDRYGSAVCRHLRRLGRVMEGYLETPDPPDQTCRVQTLHTLNRTLRTAWPRFDVGRRQVLLVALLKALVDVSSDPSVSDSVKQQIFSLVSESLTLMDRCSRGTLQCLLLQVNDSHCSPEVLRVLTSATDKIQMPPDTDTDLRTTTDASGSTEDTGESKCPGRMIPETIPASGP